MLHTTEDIHIQWTKVVLPPVFLEEEFPVSEAASETIFTTRNEINEILGGRDSRKGVGGDGAKSLSEVIRLRDVEWRRLGEDLLLTARVD